MDVGELEGTTWLRELTSSLRSQFTTQQCHVDSESAPDEQVWPLQQPGG